MENDLEEFCRKLPKIELHAHLTGSLSDASIIELIRAKRQHGMEVLQNKEEVTIQKGHNRTLDECFQIFKILHCLTDSLDAVEMMTRNVVEEFANDNVIYLELRTTPKAVQDKFTKRQYVETVLKGICRAEVDFNIQVRLLLSIDRSRGVQDGEDTLQIAKEYLTHEKYKGMIVGLDVSGNPKAGTLKDYTNILKDAKLNGLKLAVHLSEIPNDEESQHILDLGLVDRIGHGTYIHSKGNGFTTLHEAVKLHQIPIEMCITSNIKSNTASDVGSHHVKHWKEDGHPFVICTDDKGVFCTSLSNEYYIFAKHHCISKEEISKLCEAAVDTTFLSPAEKMKLKETLSIKLHSLQTSE
ncbi:N6-Methyl-AMP deaminase-like isoform X3 [Oratosquilla oratoria]|uniref:N6-Methyl-AMP deaminase-like isoform X3 n=1 Tax=Oratosquilla oratoria TaxID=337810 RepID=UPI003F777437